MNRRTFLRQASGVTALAVGATVWGPRAIVAQEASATTDLTSLELPEVRIVVDDGGFTLPSGVTAGRVLMTVENTGTQPLHFFAVRVPDEVGDAQLAMDMTAPAPPAWFDLTTLPSFGNSDWPRPGGRARGVIDVTAGRWALVDPNGGRDGALWTVGAGPTSAMGAAPAADVEVELLEMAFTGLDEAVPAGPRVWKITNQGALEHELALVPVAEGTTEAEVIQFIADLVEEDDPSQFAPVAGQGIAAKGVTGWQEFDLPPGTYAAVCMSPMPGDGYLPHAMMEMVKVFTVR